MSRKAIGRKTGFQPLMSQEMVKEIWEKNEKKYIKVAQNLFSPKTMERKIGNQKKIDDNYPKNIISTEAFSRNTVEGDETVGLRVFC